MPHTPATYPVTYSDGSPHRGPDRFTRPGRRGLGPFERFSLLVAALLAALFIYPLARMLASIVLVDGEFTLSPVLEVLADPALPEVLRNTLLVTAIASVSSVLIGTALAWFQERTDARFGTLGALLPLIPLVLPNVAMAIGWFILAQPTSGYLNSVLRMIPGITGTSGPLNIQSWAGLIWVYTLTMVPFAYLAVSAALRNLDPALEEASRVSGAGRLRSVLKISIPLIRPAIGGAFLLVTFQSLSLFSVPAVIGRAADIDVLTTFLVRLLQSYPPQLYKAMVLSVMMMLLLSIPYFLQQRLSRGGNFAKITGRTSSVSLVRLGPWKWVARAIMLSILCASSVLPFGALLLLALSPFWSATVEWGALGFSNFVEVFRDNAGAASSLQNSLQLGLVGATLIMLLAAVMMVQAQQMHGGTRRAIDAVSKVPAAIPHVVFGAAFLLAYSSAPFRLYGTLAVLLLAYVVMFMPMASVQATSAIQQIGSELGEASYTSGASRLRTFRKVTLPLLMPGLTAGWAMVFVFIVGELTASVMLSGPGNPVIGVVVLSIYTNGDITQLSALAVIMCLISGTVVGLVLGPKRWLRGRNVARLRSRLRQVIHTPLRSVPTRKAKS